MPSENLGCPQVLSSVRISAARREGRQCLVPSPSLREHAGRQAGQTGFDLRGDVVGDGLVLAVLEGVEYAPDDDPRVGLGHVCQVRDQRRVGVTQVRADDLSLLIGTSRFDDFVQRVEMAPATASTHLRVLTEAGLLERRPYREPGGRTRDEYALTQAGKDLMPVVFGLFEWGRRHAGVRPLVAFSHAGCGEPIEVQVRCVAGHDVTPDDIQWRPAPAAPDTPRTPAEISRPARPAAG